MQLVHQLHSDAACILNFPKKADFGNVKEDDADSPRTKDAKRSFNFTRKIISLQRCALTSDFFVFVFVFNFVFVFVFAQDDACYSISFLFVFLCFFSSLAVSRIKTIGTHDLGVLFVCFFFLSSYGARDTLYTFGRAPPDQQVAGGELQRIDVCRRFAEEHATSIQNLGRDARGYLCSHTDDLDMSHCSMTILRWLAVVLLGLDAPCLQNYIDNRDEILERFRRHLNNGANVHDLKKEFCACVCRQYVPRGLSDFPELVAFQHEMIVLQAAIFGQGAEDRRHQNRVDDLARRGRDVLVDAPTHMAYLRHAVLQAAHQLDLARRRHAGELDYPNVLGSGMTGLIQYYESKCLDIALDTVQRRGLHVHALMYDGLMVRSSAVSHDELIALVEAPINQAFPGLNMQWKIKPHHTTHSTTDLFLRGVVDTQHAAEVLIRSFRDRLKMIGKRGVIVCKRMVDGLWFVSLPGCRDDLALSTELKYWVSVCNLMQLPQLGAQSAVLAAFGREEPDKAQIVNHAIALLRHTVSTEDQAWSCNEMIRSRLNFLKFQNGVWDFRAREFLEGPHDDKVFFEMVPYDFVDLRRGDDADREYLRSVWHRMFRVPFRNPASGVYLAQVLCRALAGFVQKLMLICVGLKDCGKSLCAAALRAALGLLSGTWTAENLHRGNANREQAQCFRFILPHLHALIMVACEASKGRAWDSEMFRMFTNGGLDELVARAMHENEQSVVFSALPLLFANFLPVFEEDAKEYAKTRAKIIYYDYRFVARPTNPDELLMDERMKLEIKEHRFSCAFLLCIFANFVEPNGDGEIEPPAGLNVEPEFDLPEESIWVRAFEQCFEITGNKDDKIPAKQFTAILTARARMTLKGMGGKKVIEDHFADRGVFTTKTFGGHDFWAGLKVRNHVDQPQPPQE
jgi:hypothetical protein